MVSNYIVTKAIKEPTAQQIQEAHDYFINVLEDVEDQMNDIESALNVISGRNQAYVRSSSERIRFRLNNERNIKGEIGFILKRIKATGDLCEEALQDPFRLFSFRQSDSKSLFTAKAAARIAPKKIPFVPRRVPEEARRRAEEIIRQKNAFSIEAVNSFVLNGLGQKKRILLSEIPVQEMDEFVKLILVAVFSSNKEALYTIGKPTGEEFSSMGFLFEDYEIRKKEKGR